MRGGWAWVGEREAGAAAAFFGGNGGGGLEMQLKVFVVPSKNIEAMEREMNAILRGHETSPGLVP